MATFSVRIIGGRRAVGPPRQNAQSSDLENHLKWFSTYR
ncbi:hypothetical protein ALPO108162_08490 [Alicyclobacillus pomorum]